MVHWGIHCCVGVWHAAGADDIDANPDAAGDYLSNDDIACPTGGSSRRPSSRHGNDHNLCQVRETVTAAIELSAEGLLQQINEYKCIRDLGVGATAEVNDLEGERGLGGRGDGGGLS